MHKKLLFIALTWLCAMSSMGQELEIIQPFKRLEHASVLASYNNEFGSFRKPQLDIEFPYALIRLELEGDEHSVLKAKEKFSLYMGQHHSIRSKITDRDNEILFLVPIGAGHIELKCGDGCASQLLLDFPQLQADAIYQGKVRYTPAAPVKDNTDGPESQFFKFRVMPQTSVVTLVINGREENVPMREEGIASARLKFGTYQYRISAERYHTEEGTITVSSSSTEKSVTLRPRFGWLTINTDNTSQGAYVFATNTQTNVVKQLGTLPLSSKEMDSGEYILRIQKEKYKDYTTTITIQDGETTTQLANLLPNFAQVTLTTKSGAEILLDGISMGRGSWSGTIELGEHSVETRQTNHRSAYTTININAQSAGKSITLNNPVPIYGSLLVDGSPVDASVYVDGRKVGTTPLVVNDLLIGSHQVRIEKNNYKPDAKTVTVEENKEQLLEYALIPTTPTAQPAVDSRKTSPVREQKAIAKNDKGKSNTPVKSKRKTFFLANFATPFKTNMWGVGLTFGQMYNGHGWYLKGRSNFQALKTLSDVRSDENGAIIATDDIFYYDYNGDYINDLGVVPFYSGNTKTSTWMVSMGYAMDFLNKKSLRSKHSAMGMYIGLGCGASRYGLETTDGVWIEYDPWSAMGVSVDAGLMVSMGGFTIAAGLTTINFKTVEAEFSVGFML